MIFLKSQEEIERMRDANQIVALVLEGLKDIIEPGITTWDLDKTAGELTHKKGARAAFKGYRGYPASICVSVNDEVVHGIPSKKKVLKEGDIVSLDFGAYYNGFYGDSAVTVPVGGASPQAVELLEVTRDALCRGIDMARPLNRLFDISRVIQTYVEGRGFNVVRTFVGHGIGRRLHEDPQVPNFVPKDGRGFMGVRLKAGMVLAIEPMVNVGTSEVRVLEDGWTTVTCDGSLSAHFEHTVAITTEGPLILSNLDGVKA